MDDEEINRLLDEILGPPLAPPPPVTEGILDHVLGSRTHVKVLRVLVALGRRTNLNARDVARRAEASHGRVSQVLRELVSLGLVTVARAPTHGIYRLSEDHPLAETVRFLFDRERLPSP
jgi:DNA-binding transcriptional ArsR family regulator